MTQTWKGRPGSDTEAATAAAITTSSVPPRGTETWLETFTRRVIADALNEASAAYWLRRADVLEAAAPRPDEFHGRATRDELNAAWTRCMADAARCRAHAALLRDREVSGARDDWQNLLGLEVRHG